MGQLWELLQRHIEESRYKPSERQLAALLKVSPTTLTNWREREMKRLPTRENLEAVAELVGVRYAVVLDAVLWDTGYHEAIPAAVRHRSASTVEAELQVAAQDLAKWQGLKVTGDVAERRRSDAQARVDALKAELVASQSATTGTDSVAEL